VAGLRLAVRRLLERWGSASRLPTVLLRGETGTGKGLLARLMHEAGGRAGGPFVSVNCAAIPETLVEAELFGVERGAFTDAREARPGLFQAAHGGTLFLDEIGCVPLPLQAKLLTAVEERSVRRLGSTRAEPLDVWIVAAASEALQSLAAAGGFRRDLYHRLATVELELPPLRERGADILLLAEHFLAVACGHYDLPPKRLSAEARVALMAYAWPGNVRELANQMERLAVLAEGGDVGAANLGPGVTPGPAGVPPAAGGTAPLRDAVDRFERSQILAALEAAGGRLARAAVLLGVPRTTLRYRVRRMGLVGGELGETPDETPPGPARGHGPTATPVAGQPGPAPSRRSLAFLGVTVTRDADEPAEAHEALVRVLDKVRAFGGVCEAVWPGGLVATYGLDGADGAATRALHTALALQKAARREASRGTWGLPLYAGVHVRECTVRDVDGGLATAPRDRDAVLALMRELLEGATANSIVVTAAAAPLVGNRLGLWEAASDAVEAPERTRSIEVVPAARRPSVAVLPFRNLGGGAEDEYVADGLTTEIADGLSRMHWLAVIAPASTLALRSRPATPAQLAAELGVRYLVTGTVRRAGERLRVSAELVDTSDGRLLWAERHDGRVTDLFAFQDTVTACVVNRLELRVHRAEAQRALLKHPESLDAYECALRFLTLVHRFNEVDFTTAGVMIRKAIALDPRYAGACAWHAWWYLLRIGQGWSPDVPADIAEAERMAEAGVQHDPDDALVLAIAGHVASFLVRDYDRALARFERALLVNPNSALAWGLSAATLCYVGEPGTAVPRLEYALRLSPFDPVRFFLYSALAFAEMLLGRHEHAIRWARKSRHENPRFSGNLRLLAACLAHVGRLEEARQIAGEFLAIERGFDLSSFRARWALRDPVALEAHVEDLRRAGVPE
jgi:adenylate cyclase